MVTKEDVKLAQETINKFSQINGIDIYAKTIFGQGRLKIRFGVNWPGRGTQTPADTMKFVNKLTAAAKEPSSLVPLFLSSSFAYSKNSPIG